MRNKKLIIIISSVVAAGAAAYFFLIKKKGSTDKSVSSNDPVNSASETENGLIKYTVATQSTSLNIRKTPAALSPSVGSFSKGAFFIGKPASDGWVEVINMPSGMTRGFVSSQFVKPV